MKEQQRKGVFQLDLNAKPQKDITKTLDFIRAKNNLELKKKKQQEAEEVVKKQKLKEEAQEKDRNKSNLLLDSLLNGIELREAD